MITLDKRTGSFELLPHFPPGTAMLGHLEFGDASFTGNGPEGPVFIGLERKTVYDLLSSVDSGRFQGHQLPGMLNSYTYTYLIMEGLWRHGPGGILEVWGRSGWRPLQNGQRRYRTQVLHNLANTLAVKCGMMTYRTDNPSHTSSLIMDLYKWWQKGWESHRGHKGFPTTPHPVKLGTKKPSLIQKVASQLPMIGWGRSEAVDAHFASVEEMIAAGVDEWRKVDGIGKVVAESVVDAIKRREKI